MRAELRVAFARAGRRTQAARVYETGGWRLRFPRADGCEAVVVNTGGGMAGGDEVAMMISAEAGAEALVTSQSQEKVYRADGLACRLSARLECAAGARLTYAPQETLLFDGARLDRRLEADVDESATLTIFEAVAFGRLAHGETRIDAALTDRWRLRRGGRLVFAEALTIADAGATLDRPAVGAGARALATLVRIGPDAAARLEPLRARFAALEERGAFEAGASLVDGVLVARMLSPSPQRLREGLLVGLGGARRPRGAEGLALSLRLAALVAVAALILAQGLVIGRVELTYDEAYYTLWARWPQAGYLDHPPLVAWLIAASRRLFGGGEFGVRALFWLIGVSLPLLTWRIGLRLYDDAATGAAAALILVGAPLIAGAPLATPDTPLTLCWTLALLGLVEVFRGRELAWIVVGLAGGAAALAKLSAGFLGLGVALALAVCPPLRPQGRRPGPWLAAALALVVAAPFLAWNFTHGFATFYKQGGRLEAHAFAPHYLLEFVGSQLALFNPLTAALALYAASRGRGASEPTRLLIATVAPALAYFALHALHDRVQGNWLGAALSGAGADGGAGAAGEARSACGRGGAGARGDGGALSAYGERVARASAPPIRRCASAAGASFPPRSRASPTGAASCSPRAMRRLRCSRSTCRRRCQSSRTASRSVGRSGRRSISSRQASPSAARISRKNWRADTPASPSWRR